VISVSASTHLAQYSVTVEQARTFIIENLATPEIIYNTAINFNVTAQMLAEIVGGITTDDVVNFFNFIGLDGNALLETSTGVADKIDDGLTIDDNDDKITISTTDYTGYNNSAGSVLTGLSDFRADTRFNDVDGEGYTVVVIDTAFDLDHSFFGADADFNGVADRILYHEDFTNEGDGANTTDPTQNHGTHVASIIASSNSNNPGVAPGVNIITLQVLAEDGGTAGWIQKALEWVVDNAREYNVVAVNMSLGDDSNHTTRATSWASDEISRLSELGVVTVVASGNDYENYKSEGVSYPAADPNAVSVGALVSSGINSDTFASFSQRSDTLTDIVAPGADITAGNVGGGLITLSGTSMAAPFIAGVVALAQQLANKTIDRSLSVNEFVSLMQQSAVVIQDSEIADGVPNTGDNFFRIDVHSLAEQILQMGSGDPVIDDPVTPTPTPTDDIPSDSSTNAAIAVGASVIGELTEGDESDWYAITLTAGSSYRFALDGIALADPYLRLFDSASSYLASNDDANNTLNSELDYTVATSGTYYLSAGSYQGSGTGNYTLSAVQTSIVDDEPDTGNGAVGQYTGNIDYSGDSDRYLVQLAAGSTYTITLSGTSSNAGTLSDPLLQLLDANLNLVRSDDDSGTGYDSSIEFTASQSGNYYVVANGYGSSMGSYVLDISLNANADAIPDNISTGFLITDGQQLAGTIDFEYDSDWYAVSLIAGTQYSMSLSGAPSSSGTLADPNLKLYDQQGNYVTGNDDGGTGLDSELNYSPSTSGTYYISANSYNNGTGTYSLQVQSSGSDIGSDVSTASTVTLGTAVSSSIDTAYDSDWFGISLTAGTQYTINLEGAETSAGTLNDPLLGIYDSVGSFLSSDDDSGTGLNSSLVFTPQSTDTYYIAANAYSDGTGSYQLTVAGNGTSTSSLQPGTFINDSLDGSSDSDTFQVELVAGTQYQMNVFGAPSGYGTMLDPFITVQSDSGSFFTADDDSGNGYEAYLTFTATESGSHVVTIGTFDFSNGSYQLTFDYL